MSSQFRRQRGLVLVELIVIGLCVALLLTLLAPSVLATRVASRRSQCKNNLKQIGLALHNYHDTHRLFPPGWIPQDPVMESTAPSRWGWSVLILPFMEQQPLHTAMQVSSAAAQIPEPGSPNDKSLPMFLCPSDGTKTRPKKER